MGKQKDDKQGTRKEAAKRDLTDRQKADARKAEKQQVKAAKKQRRDERPRLKKIRFALVLSGLTLLAFVSWLFGVMMAVAQDLPDLEARAQYDRAENSVVYAENPADPGGPPVKLATLVGNQRRILLDSEDIDPDIKHAVVSVEDERFYDHRGVDYIALARALREDILSGGAVQGGSTITQQFVKNALEAQSERTVLQKLKESALAYQIERRWSKDKILTNYLNNIYFGEGAYGIEAAAKTFFGWNHPGCGEEDEATGEQNPPCAKDLRVEEAAMLAAMISSPTAYNPKTNPENAKSQRNIVLSKMLELGYLTEDEYPELIETSVPGAINIEVPEEESTAPYFTEWLRQQVVDRYGAGEAFGGGLEIHSTLDLALQERAEQVVSDRLSGLGPSAAVVVIDNATGEVRAMVGGSDFEASAFNLATNGLRQPGSSFKPFTLVAALEDGRTPDDLFESRQVDINFTNTITKKNGKKKKIPEVFEVNNYDDKYLGSTTLSTATTFSDNSVYAQLGMEVGPKNIAETAQSMGIQTKVPSNPAMILGGLKRGVTPLEMAYAYTTIANDGKLVSGTMASRGNGQGPVAIREVDSKRGNVKDDLGASGSNKAVIDEVLDPGTAGAAKEMLHSVVTSGTGKRAQIGGHYIWGKTGTTDDNIDAWFVGSDETYTAAVWVGYSEGGIPMQTEFGGEPVDGGTIPTLIWHDVISAAQEIQDTKDEAKQAAKLEKEAEKAAKQAEKAAEQGESAPLEEAAPPPVEAVPEPAPETAPTPAEEVAPDPAPAAETAPGVEGGALPSG